MNTTPSGLSALYRTADDIDQNAPGFELPVDGWDEDGYALVIDHKGGRRMRAVDLPNFRMLVATPSIAAVLPGQGWQCAYVNGAAPEPVIGWVIDTFGYGSPLWTDSDGVVQDDDNGLPEGAFLVPPGVEPDESPYRSRVQPEGVTQP